MTDLRLVLALQLTEKLGEKTLLNLLRNFPEIKIDDLCNNQEVHKVLKYKSVIEKIKDKEYLDKAFVKAEKLINEHKREGIDIISLHSLDYPELLKLIEDPPPILYCKGNIDLLKNSKNIAVIGTREPTQYGEIAARKLARKFASEGYTIVSGLAKGIDSFGHLGALEAENGKTIAVMAGSLDRIYPAENKKLAEKILLNDGLLVSEIGLGQNTNRGSFVRRDRIQSGLSIGVCPVQAPLKSGTHHTINYAKTQNRLLFCPMPIEDNQVAATQGIYELMEQENVLVIRDTKDYEKLFLFLTEKEISLLGEKNLLDRNQQLILQFEKDLEKLIKKGTQLVGEKNKIEEIFYKVITKNDL